jgi:adenylate kinase
VNLILLGPPGAGKGTQAKFIAKKFNLYQLSTGDLLREEIKNKTEIGKKIKHVIAHGDFVVDEIVNQLLKTVTTNPSNRNSIIFDGYPRNINQAENLETILNADNQSINFILFLKVTREVIEKRILGRITCEKCNKTFNKYLNNEEIEKHKCGNNYLKKREDDNQEVIITRYEEYMKKTKPVLDFYSSRSYFHEIDGSQKIQVITGKIEQILSV